MMDWRVVGFFLCLGMAWESHAALSVCNNDTFPTFHACIFRYEHQSSVTIKGLRGTDVFLSFMNVTVVLLDDVHITMSKKMYGDAITVSEALSQPLGYISRTLAVVTAIDVASVTVTSSRLIGFRGMIGGCLLTRNSDVIVTASVLDKCGTLLSGAMEFFHGTVSLTTVNISNSYCGSAGGAFRLQGQASMTLWDVWITNSTSDTDGGAMAVTGYSSLNATNLVVANSVAVQHGGAIYVDSNGTSFFRNLTVRNATSKGGRATSTGGAILTMGDGVVNVENALISRCSAVQGGCLGTTHGTVILKSVVFEGCVATMPWAGVALGAVAFVSGNSSVVGVDVSMPCDGDESVRCVTGDVWWNTTSGGTTSLVGNISSTCHMYAAGDNLTCSSPVPTNDTTPVPTNDTTPVPTSSKTTNAPDRNHSRALAVQARRIMDPSFSYTAAVVCGVSAVISPGGLDTFQGLVGVGMSSCSPEALKQLANEQGWTLAPLYHITGPAPYFSEPATVTPILANLFLGMPVLVIHKAVSVKTGPVKAWFPAVSLIVLGMLLQGTTYYVVRHFAGPSSGTAWDVVAVAMGTYPPALVAYAVHFHVNFRLPRSAYQAYKPSAVDSTLWQRVFIPRGCHTSIEDVYTHFSLFDVNIPVGHRGVIVRYACLIVLGIVTAVPTENCESIIGILVGMFVIPALYNLILIPTRIRIYAVTRGLGLLLNGCITLVAYLCDQSDAVSVMANAISVLMWIDFFVTAQAIYWDRIYSTDALVVGVTEALDEDMISLENTTGQASGGPRTPPPRLSPKLSFLL